MERNVPGKTQGENSDFQEFLVKQTSDGIPRGLTSEPKVIKLLSCIHTFQNLIMIWLSQNWNSPALIFLQNSSSLILQMACFPILDGLDDETLSKNKLSSDKSPFPPNFPQNMFAWKEFINVSQYNFEISKNACSELAHYFQKKWFNIYLIFSLSLKLLLYKTVHSKYATYILNYFFIFFY